MNKRALKRFKKEAINCPSDKQQDDSISIKVEFWMMKLTQKLLTKKYKVKTRINFSFKNYIISVCE